jgi:hypothetical protein
MAKPREVELQSRIQENSTVRRPSRVFEIALPETGAVV